MSFDTWMWHHLRPGVAWQVVLGETAYRAATKTLRRTGETFAAARLASGNVRLLTVEPLPGSGALPISGRTRSWILAGVLSEDGVEVGGAWAGLVAKYRASEGCDYAR